MTCAGLGGATAPSGSSSRFPADLLGLTALRFQRHPLQKKGLQPGHHHRRSCHHLLIRAVVSIPRGYLTGVRGTSIEPWAQAALRPQLSTGGMGALLWELP